MATAVATRRRVERLEGRLYVPAADVLDEPVTRYLWLSAVEGAVSVVRPDLIRELITRTWRRHRRGGISSAIVHAYLYSDADMITGPLLCPDGRLPATLDVALWLAAKCSDGEYLVIPPEGETLRIRVEHPYIDVFTNGEWGREYRVE
jgi:hypothetical protein